MVRWTALLDRRVELRKQIVALAVSLALSSVLGCGEHDRGEASSRASTAAPAVVPAAVEVTTAEVKRGPISQRISAPGSLTALRESRIGPEVRGRLWKVYVNEGDWVRANDVLFQIEPEPYVLALRQAKAARDLAQAERRQQEADLGRARALFRKDVISRQQVDRLETTVAVARASERQAQEAVELAQMNLRRTIVYAPYAGAVTQRLADEGTTAQATPQTIVIVLLETAQLEARATIPEAYMNAVHVGDRALLRVEGRTEPIETVISAVGDAVDEATRTYEVKMRVPNPRGELKAGIFVQVEIFPPPKQGALLVPREAVRTEEGRTRVLVLRDGRAEAVPVELGVVTPDAAEVRSGLQDGDRVIVGEAARTLAPGVRARDRESAPEAPETS